MVSFITRLRMALIDKSITRLFADSAFVADYNNQSYYKTCIQGGDDDATVEFFDAMMNLAGAYWPPLSSIDRTELWVVEAQKFLQFPWRRSATRAPFVERGLTFEDAVDIFLLMTIATMPDPIFKSGPGKLTHTLVATCVYQEPKKQLIPCLDAACTEGSAIEKRLYGKCGGVISFARRIKDAHDLAYGAIKLDDVL